MSFEMRDGKERLPDEEDIYGVNDVEERDVLNALFGQPTLEERLRRRKTWLRLLAGLLIFVAAVVFALYVLRNVPFPWW